MPPPVKYEHKLPNLSYKVLKVEMQTRRADMNVNPEVRASDLCSSYIGCCLASKAVPVQSIPRSYPVPSNHTNTPYPYHEKYQQLLHRRWVDVLADPTDWERDMKEFQHKFEELALFTAESLVNGGQLSFDHEVAFVNRTEAFNKTTMSLFGSSLVAMVTTVRPAAKLYVDILHRLATRRPKDLPVHTPYATMASIGGIHIIIATAAPLVVPLHIMKGTVGTSSSVAVALTEHCRQLANSTRGDIVTGLGRDGRVYLLDATQIYGSELMPRQPTDVIRQKAAEAAKHIDAHAERLEGKSVKQQVTKSTLDVREVFKNYGIPMRMVALVLERVKQPVGRLIIVTDFCARILIFAWLADIKGKGNRFAIAPQHLARLLTASVTEERLWSQALIPVLNQHYGIPNEDVQLSQMNGKLIVDLAIQKTGAVAVGSSISSFRVRMKKAPRYLDYTAGKVSQAAVAKLLRHISSVASPDQGSGADDSARILSDVRRSIFDVCVTLSFTVRLAAAGMKSKSTLGLFELLHSQASVFHDVLEEVLNGDEVAFDQTSELYRIVAFGCTPQIVTTLSEIHADFTKSGASPESLMHIAEPLYKLAKLCLADRDSLVWKARSIYISSLFAIGKQYDAIMEQERMVQEIQGFFEDNRKAFDPQLVWNVPKLFVFYSDLSRGSRMVISSMRGVLETEELFNWARQALRACPHKAHNKQAEAINEVYYTTARLHLVCRRFELCEVLAAEGLRLAEEEGGDRTRYRKLLQALNTEQGIRGRVVLRRYLKQYVRMLKLRIRYKPLFFRLKCIGRGYLARSGVATMRRGVLGELQRIGQGFIARRRAARVQYVEHEERINRSVIPPEEDEKWETMMKFAGAHRELAEMAAVEEVEEEEEETLEDEVVKEEGEEVEVQQEEAAAELDVGEDEKEIPPEEAKNEEELPPIAEQVVDATEPKEEERAEEEAGIAVKEKESSKTTTVVKVRKVRTKASPLLRIPPCRQETLTRVGRGYLARQRWGMISVIWPPAAKIVNDIRTEEIAAWKTIKSDFLKVRKANTKRQKRFNKEGNVMRIIFLQLMGRGFLARRYLLVALIEIRRKIFALEDRETYERRTVRAQEEESIGRLMEGSGNRRIRITAAIKLQRQRRSLVARRRLMVGLGIRLLQRCIKGAAVRREVALRRIQRCVRGGSSRFCFGQRRTMAVTEQAKRADIIALERVRFGAFRTDHKVAGHIFLQRVGRGYLLRKPIPYGAALAKAERRHRLAIAVAHEVIYRLFLVPFNKPRPSLRAAARLHAVSVAYRQRRALGIRRRLVLLQRVPRAFLVRRGLQWWGCIVRSERSNSVAIRREEIVRRREIKEFVSALADEHRNRLRLYRGSGPRIRMMQRVLRGFSHRRSMNTIVTAIQLPTPAHLILVHFRQPHEVQTVEHYFRHRVRQERARSFFSFLLQLVEQQRFDVGRKLMRQEAKVRKDFYSYAEDMLNEDYARIPADVYTWLLQSRGLLAERGHSLLVVKGASNTGDYVSLRGDNYKRLMSGHAVCASIKHYASSLRLALPTISSKDLNNRWDTAALQLREAFEIDIPADKRRAIVSGSTSDLVDLLVDLREFFLSLRPKEVIQRQKASPKQRPQVDKGHRLPALKRPPGKPPGVTLSEIRDAPVPPPRVHHVHSSLLEPQQTKPTKSGQHSNHLPEMKNRKRASAVPPLHKQSVGTPARASFGTQTSEARTTQTTPESAKDTGQAQLPSVYDGPEEQASAAWNNYWNYYGMINSSSGPLGAMMPMSMGYNGSQSTGHMGPPVGFGGVPVMPLQGVSSVLPHTMPPPEQQQQQQSYSVHTPVQQASTRTERALSTAASSTTGTERHSATAALFSLCAVIIKAIRRMRRSMLGADCAFTSTRHRRRAFAIAVPKLARCCGRCRPIAEALQEVLVHDPYVYRLPFCRLMCPSCSTLFFEASNAQKYPSAVKRGVLAGKPSEEVTDRPRVTLNQPRLPVWVQFGAAVAVIRFVIRIAGGTAVARTQYIQQYCRRCTPILVALGERIQALPVGYVLPSYRIAAYTAILCPPCRSKCIAATRKGTLLHQLRLPSFELVNRTAADRMAALVRVVAKVAAFIALLKGNCGMKAAAVRGVKANGSLCRRCRIIDELMWRHADACSGQLPLPKLQEYMRWACGGCFKSVGTILVPFTKRNVAMEAAAPRKARKRGGRAGSITVIVKLRTDRSIGKLYSCCIALLFARKLRPQLRRPQVLPAELQRHCHCKRCGPILAALDEAEVANTEWADDDVGQDSTEPVAVNRFLPFARYMGCVSVLCRFCRAQELFDAVQRGTGDMKGWHDRRDASTEAKELWHHVARQWFVATTVLRFVARLKRRAPKRVPRVVEGLCTRCSPVHSALLQRCRRAVCITADEVMYYAALMCRRCPEVSFLLVHKECLGQAGGAMSGALYSCPRRPVSVYPILFALQFVGVLINRHKVRRGSAAVGCCNAIKAALKERWGASKRLHVGTVKRYVSFLCEDCAANYSSSGLGLLRKPILRIRALFSLGLLYVAMRRRQGRKAEPSALLEEHEKTNYTSEEASTTAATVCPRCAPIIEMMHRHEKYSEDFGGDYFRSSYVDMLCPSCASVMGLGEESVIRSYADY